jgi:hypothetical protein
MFSIQTLGFCQQRGLFCKDILNEEAENNLMGKLVDSSIDKAPNDTVFLGRCSLLKSVQSVACDL